MKRVIILLFVLFCGTLFASEDDLRQVRSLAERGQFGAVEAFCQERFTQSDLDETDKLLLAIELVRSRSMQLLTVEPAQRTRMVNRLESLESTWLTTSADSAVPDLALAKMTLRLQFAMAYRSFGDYLRLEADAVPESSKQAAYQQARIPLQDALERLKKCQQELQSLRQRLGNNADSSLKQRLLALEHSITMQQGIAQKSLALAFPVEAERNFELRRAADTLSELASLNSTEPVMIQCKIEKAACHRLCGELDRCAEILTQLRDAPLTPECRLQTEAEWIRYQIAAGDKIAEMRRQYAADRVDVKLHPDFDLARLELFLVNNPARNIRPEIAAATKLQGTIRQLGPYWERRVGMTVGTQSSGATEWNSAEMLATLAENHYRESQFAESAELYEQAAVKADANRQTENIFQYHRLAVRSWGKALEQSKEESKTEYQNRLISLLRKLSVQNPHHPEAWELHLAAIDFQGQLVAAQPELLDDYLTLIKEHAALWQESPKLQLLHRRSVVLLERQGRIDEAAALLPLLDPAQLKTLTPAIQRLRVRQLDSEGNTQEAVDMLTMLLQQGREPATLQLFAEILTRQSDEKSLRYALEFWTELERSVPKNSEPWWTVREGIIDVLCKSNRPNDAKKSFEMLRILYPELGGAERKARLIKRFEEN